MPLFAALPADIEMWVGGGTSVVAGVHRDVSGSGDSRFDAMAQAEVGLRLARGPLYFRLDLDVQASSAPDGMPAFGFPGFLFPSWALPTRGLKIGPPEWAMLQIGREAHHVRLGIVSHPIGLEDWDNWNNYFPTFSTMINTVPGRMLGIEPGIIVGNGYEINVFGGIDLDMGDLKFKFDDPYSDVPVFGAGLTTMQELWGTWSGVALYPTLDYYVAVLALEFYPAESLWVDVNGSTGLVGVPDDAGNTTMKPWIGGELIANILPLEPLHPLVRVQGLVESDDALSSFLLTPQPTLGASAGLTYSPFPELKISLEGKVSKVEDDLMPGLFASVALRRVEPPPYAVSAPEDPPPEPPPAAAPVAETSVK